MQVTTIEEARALVGRTFERDGESWLIHSFTIDHIGVLVQCRGEQPYVKWWTRDIDKFNAWLSGATEVTEVHDA